jgi:hypothetical protein
VVSTKRNDTWVLASSITGNNQWENCISLDFYFIINRGVLIFADFMVRLTTKIKIQGNAIFPLIVACNA